MKLTAPVRLSGSLAVGAFFHFTSEATNGFIGGPIVCPFRLITGLNCPTCGTTRALGQLALGDIAESVRLNPLAIVIAIFAFAWSVNPTWTKNRIDFYRNRIRSFSSPARWTIGLVTLLTFWIWGVSRNF